MEKLYAVYIMASRQNGTLYIGMTSDLVKRVYEHRNGLIKGFTHKYAVKQLVYYTFFGDVTLAIQKEKQMKNWKRAWKLKLIEEFNPQWHDMYNDIVDFNDVPAPQIDFY